MLFDDYELQRTERRRIAVRRGMQARASEGFLVGRPRLGYRAERTARGSRARLVAEMTTALRRAFEMVVEGCEVAEVAAWLNAQGVTVQRGAPVSKCTVARMLADPYYAGLTRNGDDEFIAGSHDPIVDAGTFFKVQEKLGR